MSASLFKPIQPICRLPLAVSAQRPLSATTSSCRGLEKVRRALFAPGGGVGVDHASTRSWLQSELAEVARRDASKWEFDFKRGRPLAAVPEREARFVWKAVRLPADKLAYAPKRRRSLEEDDDNAALYAQPLERDETRTATAEEPHPLRDHQESAEISITQTHVATTDNNNLKQSKMTDFLKSRKRTAESAFSKKLATGSSFSQPSKISRKTDYS